MFKAISFLSLMFVVNSAWAQCGGGNELKSISRDQNGISELNFSIDNFGKTESVSVVDNDGMATTAFLYFSLIQKVSDDIWQEKIKWDNVKNKPVVGWKYVGARLIASLNKLQEKYKEWSTKDIKFLDFSKEAGAVVEKLGDKTPTYSSLSEIVGQFLSTNAKMHGYQVKVDSEKPRQFALVENNSDNPIGSLLVTHPFTLPPEMMAKCGGPLNVNLSSVLK